MQTSGSLAEEAERHPLAFDSLAELGNTHLSLAASSAAMDSHNSHAAATPAGPSFSRGPIPTTISGWAFNSQTPISVSSMPGRSTERFPSIRPSHAGPTSGPNSGPTSVPSSPINSSPSPAPAGMVPTPPGASDLRHPAAAQHVVLPPRPETLTRDGLKEGLTAVISEVLPRILSDDALLAKVGNFAYAGHARANQPLEAQLGSLLADRECPHPRSDLPSQTAPPQTSNRSDPSLLPPADPVPSDPPSAIPAASDDPHTLPGVNLAAYKGIPAPSPISSRELKFHASDPATVEAMITGIIDYIVIGGEHRFPGHLKHHLQDKVLAWSNELIRASPHISPNAYVREFISRWTGEVRQQSILALEDLIAHRVVQGEDSAAVYAERFRAKVRHLPDESPISLCKHYIMGLNAQLQQRCCLDREGRDWTDLSHLIQYSYAEELRLKAFTQLHPRTNSVSAPSYPSSSSFKRGQGPGTPSLPSKRIRVGSGSGSGPAAAAAVAPMETDPRPPSSAAASVAKAKAVVPTTAIPALLALPEQQCPFYEHRGRLSEVPGMRETLLQWGLCLACRKGRHTRDQCSLDSRSKPSGEERKA